VKRIIDTKTFETVVYDPNPETSQLSPDVAKTWSYLLPKMILERRKDPDYNQRFQAFLEKQSRKQNKAE